ncbi:hypothetical protein [Bradyrhizobium elkanii]|uniref:hypothetical protein n=1 Tax=Bradyrhizobium elkanii TaxID=29448 RepID=UPI0021690024|nr:hypothetical protein [Bradyrhizobium elkanii]MCS3690928.1 hypothetical protein [Bradyrhizobium elkanii]
MSPELASICDEFALDVVPNNVRAGYMQTQAEDTLESLVRLWGKDHCRSVVMSLSETGNGHAFGRPVILAASDVLRAHPDWLGSKWFDVLDGVDLMEFWGRAKVGGVAPAREYIAALICEEFVRHKTETGHVVA